MSFAKRHIDVTFQIGLGDFGEAGQDTVTLKGLRISATIDKAGSVSYQQLSMRVYGMPFDVMNRLSILGKYLIDARRNQVIVSAGDDEKGMSVCFTGTLTEGWVDTGSAPNVSFVVVAFSNYLDGMKAVPPTSFNGSADAASVVQGLAFQMQPPYSMENSGVSAQIPYPYFPGSLRDQILAVASHADFEVDFDSTKRVVAIWPKGNSRGGEVLKLSPETGLIGYPTFTDRGILVQTLYNPNITYGAELDVESPLRGRGRWVSATVTHELESETPNGKWFTHTECSLLEHGRPLPRG